MALRDTWHRTLVYFGLVKEDDYPTEERHLAEPEEELEDRYRERPNVRRPELPRGIGEPVFVTDVVPGRAEALVEQLGGEALPNPARVAERSDAVILATKPAQLAEVAMEMEGSARAIVSILGGTPLGHVEAA